MIILHAALKEEWENLTYEDAYEPRRFESLKKDGFIHCAKIENIVDVANNNLAGVKEQMVLLCIDTDNLNSEVKWEKRGSKGIKFPHVYGPINLGAVVDVINFTKDKNGMFFYPDEILKYVKYEKSCGAIIFHKFDNENKTLLINHVHGNHWAFPKGHVEEGETETQTASREIFEETGLKACIDMNFRHKIRYSPKEGVIKDVIYFIGAVNNIDVNRQVEEVNSIKWCTIDEAKKLITFKNNLLAFSAAVDYIEGKEFNQEKEKSFWTLLDTLVLESKLIIDRPKGSCHPKFKQAIYPLDYGYLEGTTSMDNQGIDVFVGSSDNKRVTGVLCTVDMMKRDSEIKILLGCTEEESRIAHEFLNATDFMKNIWIRRQ